MTRGEPDVMAVHNKPTMLTIRETARTGLIPEAAFRRLVKRSECPGFFSGNKFLVNYDRLVDWLNEQSAGMSREGVHPNS